MRWTIGKKLSLASAALFAVAFVCFGALVYSFVARVVADTVNRNLDATADLVKRIVEVGIDKNRGQVSRNLIVAEHLLGSHLYLDTSRRVELEAIHPVTEQRWSMSIPVLSAGNQQITCSSQLADLIREKTDGIVEIYQAVPEGLLLVSTTRRAIGGEPETGNLILNDSPVHKLLKNETTLFIREYIDHNWYLGAYKMIRIGEKIVAAIHVATEQVDLETLRADILSIRIGSTGFPYIIDSVGKVVVHPELEGQYIYRLPQVQEIIARKEGSIEYRERSAYGVPGRKRLEFFNYVREMNWIVVAGSYADEFFGGLQILRRVIGVVSVITVGLAILLSITFGRRFTKPVTLITKRMKEISEGEVRLDEQVNIRTNDEIGELSRYFNAFVRKIRNLQELEQRSLEVRLRDVQMTALQAQINPHFLYNTLETISFLINTDREQSIETIHLLADLLRVSLGKGEKYVRIRQELEHAMLYLAIQKVRYPDRFEMKVDVPDSLLDLYTLKFLLQPLVENSINHGLQNLESGGLIAVSARVKNDLLEISVSDNGKGMDPGCLKTVRDQLLGRAVREGLGLANTWDRIRLHFGQHYGLHVESRLGEGTKVVLSLPVLTSPPKTIQASGESWVPFLINDLERPVALG